jgi:hypothetical protein
MAKALTAKVQSDIARKDARIHFILTVGGVDYSSYLMSWTTEYSLEFGSASATFTLINDGRFNEGGSQQIDIGDVVSFKEMFGGDSMVFEKFYGIVNQRSINKSSSGMTITLVCLDYIASLQFLNIDLVVEGTKEQITDETLTPNFLPAPNEYLAQVFNFANDSIADTPLPVIAIWDRTNSLMDPQNDGFEVYYDAGQLKLGSPINALDNYDIIARQYSFYVKGVYAEDIIEDLLTQPDGYGNYLFKETSAANVIANHLTTTFRTEEARNTDVLTPNYTTSSIIIETQLSTACTTGATTIYVDDTTGFSSSGSGTVNGDAFTWTSKTSTTLVGIPATGSYSLSNHPIDSYVEYENDYSAGQVWYLSYNNLTSVLTSSNFTIPGASLSYVDQRYGRIILTTPISVLATVTCNSDYTFKTLQASAIELNRISFKSREVENRFEALNKLRKYLAPNYIFRTHGNSKIWASYLSQKTIEDYTLALETSLNYLEDTDLYTRTSFYGKNINPHNIVVGNPNVDFSSTGEEYKGLATNSLLTLIDEETNYYVYGSTLTGAGYINMEVIKPIVYVNGIPIDDSLHQQVMLEVVLETTTRTETRTGCHGISSEQYTKIHTYYYYKVKLVHSNIEPSKEILFYDAVGTLLFTISPYDDNMDYARGIYIFDGSEENLSIASISTASYWTYYSSTDLVIDYDNVLFKIAKRLIPIPEATIVRATFEYWTVMIPIHDIASVIDGRWNTQVQIEMFAEPPSNYPLCVLDLGAEYTIQALDIVAGFYKPDNYRKFDIDMRISLEYSTDGVNFYSIGDKAHNIQLTGGQSFSLEEGDLGIDFTARYIKFNLENVTMVQLGNGVWPVAFSEIAIYDNIVLNSEASLIATTTLTAPSSEPTLHVTSTEGFTSTGTAYLNLDVVKVFTYTGLTATSFTGVDFSSSSIGSIGTYVTQSIATDTTIYDYDSLLPKLGDRLYKDVRISDEYLFTQDQLDYLAKRYLQEFYKNHSKITVDVLYSPHIQVGQTIRVIDNYTHTNQNYFVESVSDNSGYYSLVLARYPAW